MYNLILAFIAMFIFSACGSSNHDATGGEGSIAFSVDWQQASNEVIPPLAKGGEGGFIGAPQLAPSPDVCVDYGLSTVAATVYNSSNSVITTAAWQCSAHSGSISSVPAGSGIWIRLEGKNSGGAVQWRGDKTGISVVSGQTATAGTVTMTYIGSDTTAPTVSSVNPASSAVNVPVTTAISAVFSENMAVSSIGDTAFTLKQGTTPVSGAVSYDTTSKTATFTPSASLSYSTTYAATITTGVKDMAGNAIANAYTWNFTTEAPPGSAPTTPTSVTTTAADKQVTISWTAVTGATSYNVYWSTIAGVTKTNGTLITGATSPYTHTALTNGTIYYYVVTAVNSYGESAASSQTSAIPLPPITSAPTGISATAGNTQATISWSAVTGATSYNLYWSTTTGVTTSNGTKITGATSPYTHTGLTNGTTYYYIITAVNIGGESTASSQTSATPQVPVSGVPTGVSATAGNSQVTISWSTVTEATSYNVYWSTTSGSGTGGTAIAVGNVTTYTHTGLTNGTSYYYVVTAVNAGGESAASAQVSATLVSPIPSAPTGVAVTAGNGQAIITWNSVSGATSYSIYWSTTSGVTKSSGTMISNASGPYIHSGLNNGTTYYYIVTAVNSYGESSESNQGSGTPSLSPTTLASGLDRPNDIVVDSTNVYWTEMGGKVKKVAINGGTVTTLATSLNYPTGIAVDSNSVYWTEWVGSGNGAVKKVSINGGAVTILADGLTYPFQIVVDSANVYWIERNSSGAVKKISINGGTVTTLASGLNSPYAIAVDSTNVYWTDSSLNKVSINGGTVTTLASGSPYGVAVDTTSVFWTTSGSVNKMSTNGGTVTTLAVSTAVGAMTVDSNSVYWTDTDGSNNRAVKKVGINGGTVTTIVTGLTETQYLAVDYTNVYWTEFNNGNVKKMPKN